MIGCVARRVPRRRAVLSERTRTWHGALSRGVCGTVPVASKHQQASKKKKKVKWRIRASIPVPLAASWCRNGHCEASDLPIDLIPHAVVVGRIQDYKLIPCLTPPSLPRRASICFRPSAATPPPKQTRVLVDPRRQPPADAAAASANACRRLGGAHPPGRPSPPTSPPPPPTTMSSQSAIAMPASPPPPPSTWCRCHHRSQSSP